MHASLSQFLEQVARRGSWTGGGGVAASGAALAAALLEKLMPSAGGGRRFRTIWHECLRLVDADARAFAAVIQALREQDRAGFRRALKAATEIPFRVAAHAQVIQVACRAARRTVNPRFHADLVCAMATARGAGEAARALIRTNLTWLNDARYTAQMRRRLRAVTSHGRSRR